MIRSNAYRETQVTTATPQQLHLMVVEGAIRAATLAEQAMEKGDFEGAHLALSNARDFVAELISGLIEERAPELVGKMKGLFVFVYRNLADADRERDIKRVRDALKILRIHHETWLSQIERLNASQTTGPSVTTPDAPRSWMT